MNKEELMILPTPQGTSHCSCLEHCLLFLAYSRGVFCWVCCNLVHNFLDATETGVRGMLSILSGFTAAVDCRGFRKFRIHVKGSVCCLVTVETEQYETDSGLSGFSEFKQLYSL